MNRQNFERLVQRALQSIPVDFLERVENLSIQVEDWPDPQTLEEVGFDDPRDLLGYYRGWPLDERGHEYGQCLPDVITIYQMAVENYVEETGDPLLKVIRETLIHELAHYFGFSEDEMDEIERLWAGDEGDFSPEGQDAS
ncbi:Zn-dependent protease [Desulfuromonas versatilis]|uniref:Zn-dependent protease n=1 Tax=Desulfuromonas versatilis TaxID=2802975 RepID=A0ABN6DZM9_9BACT|nr:metallopeptidase family protein [Desulfuromonas versatilis]BCR05517.1 Zn-dependent protease [Desulfuromonas versatilis]